MKRYTTNIPTKLQPNKLPYSGICHNKYATYRIDDAKPINTTHEEAQVNPLLQKKR